MLSASKILEVLFGFDRGVSVAFYERVRPFGCWGPVRALAGESGYEGPGAGVLATGIAGALGLIYGLLFGTGAWLLERPGLGAYVGLALAGGAMVWWSVRRIGAQSLSPPGPTT